MQKSSRNLLISHLRDDSVLRYKYYGEPTGLQGSPKEFEGKIDVKNLDTNYFSLDLSTQEIIIYSAVVNSKAFKRDIKPLCFVAVFFKDGKSNNPKIILLNRFETGGSENCQLLPLTFPVIQTKILSKTF
jgi:hypothetical protein